MSTYEKDTPKLSFYTKDMHNFNIMLCTSVHVRYWHPSTQFVSDLQNQHSKSISDKPMTRRNHVQYVMHIGINLGVSQEI